MSDDYRITTTIDRDAHGPHWDSLNPVESHLKHEIRFMAATLAVMREEATADQLDTLDVTLQDIEDCDSSELAWQLVNEWPLEARIARWDTPERDLARAVIVLGTGGPHVELNVDAGATGNVESITLDRYWSGHQSALTTDQRACEIVGDFLSAFFVVE